MAIIQRINTQNVDILSTKEETNISAHRYGNQNKMDIPLNKVQPITSKKEKFKERNVMKKCNNIGTNYCNF
jgi:hypothetical protein